MLASAYPVVSISELSAFGGARLRSIAIVLRAGFDGSGKSSSRYLTLSTIGADDPAWSEFEDRWAAVLKSFGVPYSHMHEVALKKKPEGSPFFGWDLERGRGFALALMNALGQMRQALMPVSITIAMEDYRELRAASRDAVKPAPAISIDYCMAHVMGHPRFEDGKAEMFFDKDEEFIRYLQGAWSRNKRDRSHWANYVTTVAPVDMREVRVVQGADLLAWSMNRYYSRLCGEGEMDLDVWQNNAAMLELIGNRSAIYRRDELAAHAGFYGWKRG